MASGSEGFSDRSLVHQRKTGHQGEGDPLLPIPVRSSYSPTMSSQNTSVDSSSTLQRHGDISESNSRRSPPTDITCANGTTTDNEGSCSENETAVSDHCHRFEEMGDDRTATRQLIAVSVLCFLFMSAEIIGGLLAGSLAIATDATHMASDLAGFLISLFAIWMKKRPATRRFSFGFYRAEVLGALISILIIWVVTAVLVYMAVQRVKDQTFKLESLPMLITASVGVAFNIAMGAVLHFKQCNIKSAFGHGHSHGGGGHGHSHGGGGHGHSHGGGDGHGHSHDRRDHSHGGGGHGHSHEHSHQHSGSLNHYHPHAPVDSLVVNDNGSNRYSVLSIDSTVDDDQLILAEDFSCAAHGTPVSDVDVKRKTNINIRAAFVHVVGDLIQSIGVLVAAVVIHVSPESKIADPICTFIFSFLVLCTTFGVLRDILLVILEGVPRDVDYGAMKLDLQRIPGVQMAHSLNVWSLTMDAIVVNVHLAVAEDVRWQAVTFEASELLRKKYQIYQSTIQVEEYQHGIMSSCRKCQVP